jgi:hypothetical protein
MEVAINSILVVDPDGFSLTFVSSEASPSSHLSTMWRGGGSRPPFPELAVKHITRAGKIIEKLGQFVQIQDVWDELAEMAVCVDALHGHCPDPYFTLVIHGPSDLSFKIHLHFTLVLAGVYSNGSFGRILALREHR